jgi:nucleotide-binding universal stress UspA family protein
MNWLPKDKVLVPIDFSPESMGALDTALQMVDDPSHIHVMHVLPHLSPTEPGVIWGTVDDESRIQHAEQAIRDSLKDPKYKDAVVTVTIGDPARQITGYAERTGMELIVLPSHGRTGGARLLIGSVAERVVRLAHCPVLVIRR